MMGIFTVAEFVETSAIATKLQAIGVDYAQGYGIERPKAPFESKSLPQRAKTFSDHVQVLNE